jgi:hypothetical protein
MADEFDLKKVWVQPGIPGKVGLWARGPEYEGGEIMIAWGQGECPPPVQVPLTTAVSQALAHGQLVHANPGNVESTPELEKVALKSKKATSEPKVRQSKDTVGT